MNQQACEIKPHPLARTRMPQGKYRFRLEDVAGTPSMGDWLGHLSPAKFNRPLRVCFPCVGINNGGRYLHEAGYMYQVSGAYDLLTNLNEPLLDLDPESTNSLHLGKAAGDVTAVALKDIKRPVDALMAGPPCPPWAGLGKQKTFS